MKTLSLVCAAALACTFLACGGSSRTKAAKTLPAKPAPAHVAVNAVPDFTFTAEEWIAESQAGKMPGKYLGKTIEVRGRLDGGGRLGDKSSFQIRVVGPTTPKTKGVLCEGEIVDNLPMNGEQITIRGICYIDEPTFTPLKDCIINPG